MLSPESVCNSVDVDGTGRISPAAELHCYKIKQAPGQAAFDEGRSAGGQRVRAGERRRAEAEAPLRAVDAREPAMCGDGFRDPGEQCDDGNLIPGDGCDAHCRLESCGNGVLNSGEECDDGAANGTDDCCSSLCQLVDPDGDGVCTRDDVCPADTDNDSDGDGYCVGTAFQPPAIGGDDPCSRSGRRATGSSRR